MRNKKSINQILGVRSEKRNPSSVPLLVHISFFLDNNISFSSLNVKRMLNFCDAVPKRKRSMNKSPSRISQRVSCWNVFFSLGIESRLFLGKCLVDDLWSMISPQISPPDKFWLDFCCRSHHLFIYFSNASLPYCALNTHTTAN